MSRRNLRKAAYCVILALSGCVASAADEKPAASAPATSPATAEKSKRGVPEIMGDFQKESAGLGEVLSSPEALTDEAKRTEAAPKVIPAMKKMSGFLDELRQTGDARGKNIADQISPQIETFLVLFGDKETTDRLERVRKALRRPSPSALKPPCSWRIGSRLQRMPPSSKSSWIRPQRSQRIMRATRS